MGTAELTYGFARDHQVALDGEILLVGPGASLIGLREARRIARRPVRLEVMSAEDFLAALGVLYGGQAEMAHETEVSFELNNAASNVAVRDLLEDVADAPVIRLVNQLLRQAVRQGASDLHLEPLEDGLRARVRIDGTLQSVFDRRDVPARRVVSRLKVMAGLDIAETRLPQDGRLALTLAGRTVDVRISTLPGHHGERVVLRLLDRSSGLMPLEALGLRPSQVELLTRLAALPNGLILATGPTGSGKTTTLYSLLRLADQKERNIVTVEDPVEYELSGISQCQVNSEIGLSFARGLRSVLRQDPDVILVGEIRDGDTAKVAAEAALTGHLVFSSLHANSPLASVVRLRELGVENYVISATLRGVVAQRLLRRLCVHCRREVATDAAEAHLFNRADLPIPKFLYASVGCDACDETGYSGRVGVFEIVEVTEVLRQAIDTGASEQKMRDLGLTPTTSLFRAGLERAVQGDTTIAEIIRVVGDGS